MTERLRPRDLAFLAAETRATPMHNMTVEVFDPASSGFNYEALVSLIADRIAFAPRYRQRLQEVPAKLANPIWMDDTEFDLGYHVRRSALPRPGSMAQLRDLVGRIMSRPLDRNRPLWETYFVEGLTGDMVAVVSKSHQILVDGVSTVDLGQVLLDVAPEPKQLESDDWSPRPRLKPAALVADAVRDTVRRPSVLAGTVRAHAEAAARRADEARDRAALAALTMTNRTPQPESPINTELSEQRRFVTVHTALADYRKVRDVHGGTVNDVILASVTGGLRAWLMTRSESLGGRTSLRAMVPMSVIDDDLEATSLGTQIAGHLVDLPIGEPSPIVRLHQVSYAFKAHGETGRAVAANRLAGIAGFAPTTFHALGSRVAAAQAQARSAGRKGFNLSVTNVPGPQFPLYAAGAKMLETYPVHPLLPGNALAIGVTSYDGSVFYGITADRDALPDVEVLGQCISEALDELVDASELRPRAPRGRKKSGNAKKAGS